MRSGGLGIALCVLGALVCAKEAEGIPFSGANVGGNFQKPQSGPQGRPEREITVPMRSFSGPPTPDACSGCYGNGGPCDFGACRQVITVRHPVDDQAATVFPHMQGFLFGDTGCGPEEEEAHCRSQTTVSIETAQSVPVEEQIDLDCHSFMDGYPNVINPAQPTNITSGTKWADLFWDSLLNGFFQYTSGLVKTYIKDPGNLTNPEHDPKTRFMYTMASNWPVQCEETGTSEADYYLSYMYAEQESVELVNSRERVLVYCGDFVIANAVFESTFEFGGNFAIPLDNPYIAQAGGERFLKPVQAMTYVYGTEIYLSSDTNQENPIEMEFATEVNISAHAIQYGPKRNLLLTPTRSPIPFPNHPSGDPRCKIQPFAAEPILD